MRAEGVFNDEEERRNERKKSQAQQVCARVYACVSVVDRVGGVRVRVGV